MSKECKQNQNLTIWPEIADGPKFSQIQANTSIVKIISTATIFK